MCIKSKFVSSTFIILILILIALMAGTEILNPTSLSAQYWALMPPYNVLWPLWSPALSPIDPVTGLATPLIPELTKRSILPIQPCLVWEPSMDAPWPLYNIPPLFGGGVAFFDQIYGLNPWPPVYLTDPITGSPSPITWLTTWSLLAPIDVGHLEYLISIANATFALTYNIRGTEFLNLLTAADIWGLPPIVPF